MSDKDETRPRGADLEIWEEWPAGKGYDELGVLYPRRIKINGIDTLTPDDKPIAVLSNASHKEAFTATLHVFVRSLTIHGEEVEGLPEPPKPSGPLPRIVVNSSPDAPPIQNDDEPGELHLGGYNNAEKWLRRGLLVVDYARAEHEDNAAATASLRQDGIAHPDGPTWLARTEPHEVRFDGTYDELRAALEATGRNWSITHHHPAPER